METLDNLLEFYDDAMHLPTKPSFKKLDSRHIEDENKSVKWNCEFVEENNKKYFEEVSKLQRERNLKINQAQKDVEKYIQTEAGVSEKGAKAIFQFAYENGHCDGIYSIKDWLFDLMDLVAKCKEN